MPQCDHGETDSRLVATVLCIEETAEHLSGKHCRLDTDFIVILIGNFPKLKFNSSTNIRNFWFWHTVGALIVLFQSSPVALPVILH